MMMMMLMMMIHCLWKGFDVDLSMVHFFSFAAFDEDAAHNGPMAEAVEDTLDYSGPGFLGLTLRFCLANIQYS